jgi:hypothetical protein
VVLAPTQVVLVVVIVEQIERSSSVSCADGEQIMSVLNEEFADHLDQEWEPKPYGLECDWIYWTLR